jgi:hypothetical protein
VAETDRVGKPPLSGFCLKIVQSRARFVEITMANRNEIGFVALQHATKEGLTGMTSKELKDHALECRRVAASLANPHERRVLLEAASEYEAQADRLERTSQSVTIPLPTAYPSGYSSLIRLA